MLLTLLSVLSLLAPDSIDVCVEDEVTRAPVSGTHVTGFAGSGRIAFVRIMASRCLRLPRLPLQFRRVGYRAQLVALPAGTGVLQVSLVPLSHTASGEVARLATTRVIASKAGTGATSTARVAETLDIADARERGVSTASELLSALPFVFTRSARGETGVSLRGARREQVAITLDGMPLADPATGIADVSDLPLAALGSATVVLGADALGAGPGSSGGLIALQSAPQRVVSSSVGAFGRRAVEGAWLVTAGDVLWQASASHRVSVNDFPFLNEAGASDVAARERRVNNDERRSTVSVGVRGRSAQFATILSSGERGMVGAENVRAYDADRAQTNRALVRAQIAGERLQFVTGLRAFSLRYHDPDHSALDASASVVAGDGEASGRLGELQWRLGGGGDRVRASGGIEQSRGRAFAVGEFVRRSERGSLDVGGRLDAIGAFGALPSFSAATERTLLRLGARSVSLSVGARIGQSVRVPTLFDLYFASPQRLFVRPLRPERVTVDAEVLARAAGRTGTGSWTLQGSAVSRDTRDAIIWFPGNFGWSPANVGRERLRGLEARARFVSAWGEVSAWTTDYDAMLRTDALQIPTPYVPRLAGGAELLMRFGASTLTVRANSQGRRPYTVGPRDPAFELPAVVLADISVSRRFVLRHAEAVFAATLDNVSNERWQAIRGFPSPGRSWAITTTIQPTSK